MDCSHGTHICIESLYEYRSAKPGLTYGLMPVCHSEWVPILAPIPAGSHGLVFTASVSASGAAISVITQEGRLIATLLYPEERSWECEKK